MLDTKITDSISTDQFKAFLLEQIKRTIKKGYKKHLHHLDQLHQKQLKIIYDAQSKVPQDVLDTLVLLDEKTFSENRKSILDIGNNMSREIENLFDNLIINIDNKEGL